MDNVHSLNEIVQGMLREGKHTYAFFLDVRRAGAAPQRVVGQLPMVRMRARTRAVLPPLLYCYYVVNRI